jgi:hypothetical protein
MCIACSQGIPACAINSACAIGVQQAVGVGVIFGAGFLAIAKNWISYQFFRFINYIKENNKNNWE